MAAKAKTGEAVVKELARKDFNKQCFDCGRGVRQRESTHHTAALRSLAHLLTSIARVA